MQNSQYKLFRQRYKFNNDSFIAKGGFGKVYKVQDIEQNVFKVEKISLSSIHSKDRKAILQQPQLIIRLDHPNIIKGFEYIIQQKRDEYDNSITEQFIHIIMEYYNGKELSNYLGNLTIAQVVKIYRQIKSALLYLQKQKIVHRDISLDNILVDNNMNIKITDFGIASALKEEKYYITEKRRGKKSYLAPEVWQFKVGINADLWALGIIILQLFFGDKIHDLYGSNPGDKEQFPMNFYEKNIIPYEIKMIVEPLLQRDYNKRNFYEIEFNHIKTDKIFIRKMTELFLAFNNIGKEGAVEIAQNLKNLTILDLSSNNIQTQGAIEIGKNLLLLTWLNLSCNNIGTQGALEIGNNLRNLTWLQLAHNNIETQGAVRIAENLKKLTMLNLDNNKIYEKERIKQLIKVRYIYI